MSKSATKPKRRKARKASPPLSSPLFAGEDSGNAIHINYEPFIGSGGRDRSWGALLDGFLSLNRQAFNELSLEPEIKSSRDGYELKLKPGLRAGAIPLRSPVTGEVAGGVLVRPRFGWPNVGRVLSLVGWKAGPKFSALPMVPGSGREVPPWVMAGPILARMAGLLANLRKGYVRRKEVRTQPRGRINWREYGSKMLPQGQWHHLPCEFAELGVDPKLRQFIRWTLEHVRRNIGESGGADPIASALLQECVHLLTMVSDVTPQRPSHHDLKQKQGGSPLTSKKLSFGLEAMSWVVDERGLGGGQSLDGLAWSLPLEQLWELYVGSLLKKETLIAGGRLYSGDERETIVPIQWSHYSGAALSHLVPDFIIRRGDEVEVIDAKYKSHFAALDYRRWHSMIESQRETMRADIHQILAYAAVAGGRGRVRARLVYPVNVTLYEEIRERDQLASIAQIPSGDRSIELRLEAASFGEF